MVIFFSRPNGAEYNALNASPIGLVYYFECPANISIWYRGTLNSLKVLAVYTKKYTLKDENIRKSVLDWG